MEIRKMRGMEIRSMRCSESRSRRGMEIRGRGVWKGGSGEVGKAGGQDLLGDSLDHPEVLVHLTVLLHHLLETFLLGLADVHVSQGQVPGGEGGGVGI